MRSGVALLDGAPVSQMPRCHFRFLNYSNACRLEAFTLALPDYEEPRQVTPSSCTYHQPPRTARAGKLMCLEVKPTLPSPKPTSHAVTELPKTVLDAQ